MKRVTDYLAATGALVVPLYQLEKAGGLARMAQLKAERVLGY